MVLTGALSARENPLVPGRYYCHVVPTRVGSDGTLFAPSESVRFVGMYIRPDPHGSVFSLEGVQHTVGRDHFLETGHHLHGEWPPPRSMNLFTTPVVGMG
jgi:hypothetical protein